MKKPTLIGLILGIVFGVLGLIGTSICTWNPAHYVSRGVLCDVGGWIFYLPTMLPQILAFLMFPGIETVPRFSILIDKIGFVSAVILFTVIEFILIAYIISWFFRLFRKIRNKKK